MTTTAGQLPKHDLRKYRDTIKLDEDNWTDWSDIKEAVLLERGLWKITIGKDLRPLDPAAAATQNEKEAALKLIEEWEDRDSAARTQIIQNLMPSVRNKVRGAKMAAEVWNKLKAEYESKDPERIFAVRTRYDNLVLGDKTITEYIEELQELRSRLDRMGDKIPDQSFAARLIMNLPESWDSIANALRVMTSDPEVTISKLKGHQAYLDAVASKLGPRSRNLKSIHTQALVSIDLPKSHSSANIPAGVCEVCEKPGHTRASCFNPGGGQAGKWPSAWKWVVLKNPNWDGTSQQSRPTSRPPMRNHGKSAAEESAPNENTSATWVVTPSGSSFSVKGSDWWVLDSGATSHLTANRALLFNYEEIPPIPFRTAKREVSFTAVGKGHAKLIFKNHTGDFAVTLTEVLYAPDCDANLISVSILGDKGVTVTFDKNSCILRQNGKVVGQLKRSGNLFCIPAEQHVSQPPPTTQQAALSKGPRSVPLEVWHHRLGHPNFQTLTKMAKSNVVSGLDVSNFDISTCTPCIAGKQDQVSFPPSSFSAKAPLELVYCDLMGQFPASIGGSIYAMTIFDSRSGYISVYFLKHKSMNDTLNCLASWVPWVERQSGHTVKTITTDNGTEFVNEAWKQYCTERGIVLRTTAPYTPQQNGKAERQNRILQEGELALRHAANLPVCFWAEAMATIAYLRNCIPNSNNPNMTPIETLFGIKPDVSHLRTFGCQTFVKIPDDIRAKGSFKSFETIFVGYFENSKAYKLYDSTSGKFIKALTITCLEDNIVRNSQSSAPMDEEDIPLSADIPILFDPDAPAPAPASPLRDTSPLTELPDKPTAPQLPPSLNPVAQGDTVNLWNDPSNDSYGRGHRRGATAFFAGTEDFSYAQWPLPREPNHHYELKSRPDRQQWIDAMAEEIKQLHDTGTWELVPLPEGRKAIGCRWVYRLKMDADGNPTRYKARLVAQGFPKCRGLTSASVSHPLPDSLRSA
jgi:hypothetical protein